MASPRIPHLAAAHKLVRYLKGSAGQGLFFSSFSSYTLKPIVMLFGPLIKIPEDLFLVIVSCLLILWCPGSVKDNIQSHAL